ncbi:DUF4998 domain-containing protein [Leeuwenhoekiella sp. MAR_2009_132]|uniref:DUF4998 domain-containing protein n=1 Tax=Leeuwenhoekiella sp. MAR_2009_132 TaxID=1392489 RepID=UPI000690ACF1|nr:DUF4998 domain-containing protein [Leeuwenhoekiella sp. MAR_2009_132]
MKIHKLTKIVLLVLLTVLGSCADVAEMDDFKDFTADGEINYSEKVDSLKIFSGKNRAKIQGIVDADPKITEFRVYWDSKKDSVVVPITRSIGIDTLEVIISDLPENIYNFEIRTFDSQGNSSIPVSATGEVYGERYQATLFNRPVIANNLIEDSLVINYAGMDLTSGVLGTEIVYTNTSDEEIELYVPIAEPSVTILDFKNSSTYKYRTLFKPEETAIDTFYTAYNNLKPIPKPLMVNAKMPFATSARSGRWGTVAEWTTNDNAKTHGNPPVGGFDNNGGRDAMGLESWGSPLIRNGKIHQMVDVQPASYSLNVNLSNGNKLSEAGTRVFIVVAKGEGLPDIDDVTTSTDVLGFKKITATGNIIVDFISEENAPVSVGIVTDFTVDQSYWKILEWDIVVK